MKGKVSDIVGGGEQSTAVEPFRDAYSTYREQGWLGTIPLQAGTKHPPPTGWTGRAAQYPDDDQIDIWLGKPRYKNGNIALHLGPTPDPKFEVIGIDVDHYGDKRGGDQLHELEAEYGKLPPTWVSSSRPTPSGIRFYRVPAGYAFQGKLSSAIDIVQRAHRYAVVWPSVHPVSGGYYLWRNPVGEESSEVPGVDELALLPKAWFQFLTRGGIVDGGPIPIDMDATKQEMEAWLESVFPTREDTPCDRMQQAADKWITAIEDDESSHDKIAGAHWELTRLAVEGHTGLLPAMQEVCDAYVGNTQRRGKRAKGELSGEVSRSYWGALRKTKAELDSAEIGPCSAGTDPCPPICDMESGRRASRSLAGVEPAAVRWLWKGWLPLGKVSLFEGDPDVGKSTVTLCWASIVSTGGQWPPTVIGDRTLRSKSEPAGVLLVGVEDGHEDTVVPRLIASNADLNRVHVLERPVDKNGKPVPFTIPNDVGWLRQAVIEAAAKLVVIDPITACLPENTKHGVDAEIRRILQYLSDLAREQDCSIVLIRHFNKATGMSAKHRGGGSIAFTAVVRSVLSAAVLKEPGPQGETHAIARAKGNLSREPRSIGYSLIKAPDHPDLPEPEDEELGASIVEWGGPLDLNADQLVGADDARKTGDARTHAPARDECETVIRELLADGPMRVEDVKAKVQKAVGCGAKPVNAAAKLIGIIRTPVRPDGPIDHWTWELPPIITKLPRIGDGPDE